MTLAQTAYDLQRTPGGGSSWARHPDQGPRRAPLHAVERARRPDAGVHRRAARDLDAWQNRTRLPVRGRALPAHPDDADVLPSRPRCGPPPVYLAAVGPLMTRLAGEVADGLLVHGFTTERYLREHTLPALAEGLALSGRSREHRRHAARARHAAGPHRGGHGRGDSRGEGDDRLLRQHPRLPASSWSCTGGARSATSCTRCRSAITTVDRDARPRRRRGARGLRRRRRAQ